MFETQGYHISFLTFHFNFSFSSKSTAIKSYFSAMFDCLHAQQGPWVISLANRIIVFSLKCKLFFGQKWIFWLGIHYKDYEYQSNFLNSPKTEIQNQFTLKSSKSCHHKLHVKKGMLPNTTGITIVLTWHTIPHLSAVYKVAQ